MTALTLWTTSVLVADEAKFQKRVNESTEYKEDVQYKYRYNPDEPKEYKGEYKPKFQYQHRNNMNSDPFGSGMGNMRSMGGSKGMGKR